jgi:hypothetical protein
MATATGLSAMQDAAEQTADDASEPAKEIPTSPRKRVVMVRRKGVPANGPDELSWEEFESLGCDRSRVPDYVRKRDLERKAADAEA